MFACSMGPAANATDKEHGGLDLLGLSNHSGMFLGKCACQAAQRNHVFGGIRGVAAT